jgi:hypothetical protein
MHHPLCVLHALLLFSLLWNYNVCYRPCIVAQDSCVKVDRGQRTRDWTIVAANWIVVFDIVICQTQRFRNWVCFYYHV